MNRILIYILALISVWNGVARATDESRLESVKFLPAEASHATWVFSGTVTTDSGEVYGYFFQMERNDQHFHATATLIDEVSKKEMFREDTQADINPTAPYDWRVGHAFLRLNPINDSWIFGVKPKNHFGFNFKVDMLKQFVSAPRSHHLRPGMTMMVTQTGELNGHIITESERGEQFVRAKAAWFRQIWQDEQDTQPHALTSALCNFMDGSGFYSVSLRESDAQSGSVAGWYDAQGLRKPMSQFVQVSHQKDGGWLIHSPLPRLNLVMLDEVQLNSVLVGFVRGVKAPGFCVLSV